MDNYIMIMCSLASPITRMNGISVIGCNVNQNNKTEPIKVIGVSEFVQKKMKEYMHSANIGLRMLIQGSLIFGERVITINATDITLIDSFEIEEEKIYMSGEIDFIAD